MASRKKITPASISEFTDSALLVEWSDGHSSIYPYEDLRLVCPCATCRRLRSKSRTGKLPLKNDGNLRPEKIDKVGMYAVQFKWNDGHDTGIYTFDFLREKCPCEQCNA
ncbi:MAG: DUF971 domain-containing protein [Thermodesulfobacteriota bacterium]